MERFLQVYSLVSNYQPYACYLLLQCLMQTSSLAGNYSNIADQTDGP